MMLKNDAVKDAPLWARLYSAECVVGTVGGVQCTMGTPPPLTTVVTGT